MSTSIPGVATDPLQEVFNGGRNLTPAAVGSQLAIMTLLSLVTILVFSFLRPRNKTIYQPKVKYHPSGKMPPRISDSFFGWVSPLAHTHQPELLVKIGLDAVAFLHFLHLLRWLFTGMAVLTCGVLIPINYAHNKQHSPKHWDVLSITTIRDVQGVTLYAHVTVTYLITILVVVLVYIHWRDMTSMRNQWFRSPEYLLSFYARTLCITQVPKKLQSDIGLQMVLNSVEMPYPVTSVHIGRAVGELPDLIEYHNQTVRELEGVLVSYLKSDQRRQRKPTIRIGGYFGCGGTRKDAIEFYTEKLKRTRTAVEQYRSHIHAQQAENYGFASFVTVPHAHAAARVLENQKSYRGNITLAPNPKGIIWSNLSKSNASKSLKRFIGFWWLGIICLLSLVPLFPVATFANLDAIAATGYFPSLESWSANSPVTFAFVSGVLPPTIAGIFTVFLPRVMRWLSRYMGALTHASLDKAVIARYFAFLIISQLFVFTLIGVGFNLVIEIVALIGKRANVQQILGQFHQLPDSINRTYINQASYWLKWFPLRGFLVVFDLAQIWNLLWLSIKTRIFGRTPRDIREWTRPPAFDYSVYYSNLLFMSAVGLLFAPLAPLVALSAAVIFWISSWIYKYQLLFVFVTKVETGGRLWNVVINRLLFSVLLMQALMVLTIGLQYKFRSLQWLSTVPPLLIIGLFKIFLRRKFEKNFHHYIPTQEELKHVKLNSGRSDAFGHKLEHRFGHPALHAKLYTPMLHAEMMPLLGEVYKGAADQESWLSEGIKFTAVEKNDLEYDPILYQREQDCNEQTAVFFDEPISHGQRKPSLLHKPAPISNHDRCLPKHLYSLAAPLEQLNEKKKSSNSEIPGFFNEQPQWVLQQPSTPKRNRLRSSRNDATQR